MATIACIVPTHNRPSGLRRALRSVVEQTHPPTEIIVVDDVASPATPNVIEEFQGVAEIRLLQPDIATERRSAGTSRNYGAREASSDYLAFLDDDDHWHPAFLERLAEALREHDTQLACSWIAVQSQGREVRVRRPAPHLRVEDVITRNPGFTGSNFLIRRSAFELIGGFDPNLPVANDIDFLVRALQNGVDYAVAPQALAYQTTDGRDHLSSRTSRRAKSIDTFEAKYRHIMSSQDLRRIRRDKYDAMRYPEQKFWWRAYYFFMSVATAERKDWVFKLRKMARREPSDYA